MLRSHSHYGSGLYQTLLAIVNLLCKFLAAVFVHVLRTLAAAIRVMPAKNSIAVVPDAFKGKILAQNSTHQLREAPVTRNAQEADSKPPLDACCWLLPHEAHGHLGGHLAKCANTCGRLQASNRAGDIIFVCLFCG